MKKLIVFTLILISLLFISQITYCQPNREEWQPPEEVLNAIGIETGMIIGEIGAGRGYMTFPLLERVGPEGKVYANDISIRDLNYLKEKAKREGFTNLETIEGKVDDPVFPVNELNLMIMVYVFHDLTQPIEFTKNTLRYLKDSGTLVLVEKDIIKDPDGEDHFLPQKELLEKMSKTGYKLLRTETFLKYDNIYIFGKD